MAYHRMTSRFKGKCPRCGDTWAVGGEIGHDKTATPKTLCWKCAQEVNKTPKAPQPQPESLPELPPPPAGKATSDTFAVFKAACPSLAFSYEPNGENTKAFMSMHATDVLPFLSTLKDDHKRLKYTHNKDSNSPRSKFGDFKAPSVHDHFRGGSIDSLLTSLSSGADTSQHEETHRAWGPKIEKEIIACLGGALKRRNFRNEDSGDIQEGWHVFESDRPFTRRKRQQAIQPKLELEVYIGANCHIGSDDLDKYGRILWALVREIESKGALVKLSVHFHATRFYRGSERSESFGDKKGSRLHVRLDVKDFGEYLAPSTLASYLAANYFRRVGFAQICLASEWIDKDVDYALGVTVQPPLSVEPGKITLALENIDSEASEVLKKLKEALKS